MTTICYYDGAIASDTLVHTPLGPQMVAKCGFHKNKVGDEFLFGSTGSISTLHLLEHGVKKLALEDGETFYHPEKIHRSMPAELQQNCIAILVIKVKGENVRA